MWRSVVRGGRVGTWAQWFQTFQGRSEMWINATQSRIFLFFFQKKKRDAGSERQKSQDRCEIEMKCYKKNLKCMAHTRSCESQIKHCEPDLAYRSLAKFKGIYE